MNPLTEQGYSELDAMTDNALELGRESLIDDLTYFSYRQQRRQAPHIAPERWARVFTNQAEMEERYQNELNPFRPHGISVQAHNDHVFGPRD